MAPKSMSSEKENIELKGKEKNNGSQNCDCRTAND